MERRTPGPTFVDAMMNDLGGPKSRAFFEAVETAIDWSGLASAIGDVYADRRGPGRPHWPVEQMLKCLILAKWFNLSDPQLEEVLQDRLSFRRFVGLMLDDATPDETTFVRFRRRLREAGHDQTLLAGVLAQLERQGVVVNEGTLIDASIIEAPRGRRRSDGTSTRDQEASFTRKHGRTSFGYRAHIATDRRGVIRDVVFDTAKVNEQVHMDRLIGDESHSVYADRAYMDHRRKHRLQSQGMYCGIMERRGRGQEELTPRQKWHNALCAKVRAVVEHPFAWIRNMGYRRVRYRGRRRNEFDFALLTVAYNIKRSLSLTVVSGPP